MICAAEDIPQINDSGRYTNNTRLFVDLTLTQPLRSCRNGVGTHFTVYKLYLGQKCFISSQNPVLKKITQIVRSTIVQKLINLVLLKNKWNTELTA